MKLSLLYRCFIVSVYSTQCRLEWREGRTWTRPSLGAAEIWRNILYAPWVVRRTSRKLYIFHRHELEMWAGCRGTTIRLRRKEWWRIYSSKRLLDVDTLVWIQSNWGSEKTFSNRIESSPPQPLSYEPGFTCECVVHMCRGSTRQFTL